MPLRPLVLSPSRQHVPPREWDRLCAPLFLSGGAWRACIGFRAVESDGERGVCNWTALFLLLPLAILICSWLAAEVDVERAHAAPAQALAAPVRYDVSHPTWSIPR